MSLTGCDDAPTASPPTPDPPPPHWACPDGWIPYAAGGCAPRDLVALDADAATPWPAADWSPDAGIPTCPDGWTHLADGTCDPHADRDCGDTAGPLPGDRCTPTRADNCPSGRYLSLPVEAMGHTALYVDPSFTGDPTGDPEHPYPTLDTALTKAHDDDWILLAAGTYDAHHTVVDRRHIVGLCAARVTLRAPDDAPALRAEGATARLDLRGVTVQGGASALSATEDATLTVDSVAIVDPREHAVRAEGGGTHVTLRGLFVRDALHTADGLSAHDGATVTASDVSLRGCATRALQAEDHDSALTVTGAVVEDTAVAPDGKTQGYGADVTAGAHLTLREFVIRHVREYGVHVSGAGSVATLSDGVVRDTRPNPGTAGHGLDLDGAGSAVVDRVLFDANQEFAINLAEASTALTLRDATLQRTVVREGDGYFGGGVQAADASSVTMARVLVRDMHTQAVWFLRHAHGDLEDLVIDGSLAGDPNGLSGRCLEVRCGSTVNVRRFRLAHCALGGAACTGSDDEPDDGCRIPTSLRLADGVVVDAFPRANGSAGRGLASQHGGRLTAERVRVTASRELGVFLYNKFAETTARVHMSDSLVEDTLGSPQRDAGVDGSILGFGVFALDPLDRPNGLDARSTITLERVTVRNSHEAGVAAGGRGAGLDLHDVRVLDTQPSSRGLGIGVALGSGARMEAERLAVDRAHGAGVYVVTIRELSHGIASASVRDLFVRDVQPSQLAYRASFDLHRDGVPVSYGAFVGFDHELRMERGVFDLGQYGLATAGGDLYFTDGVVSRQSIALGAQFNVDPTRLRLVRVVGRANASAQFLPVELRDEGLPIPTLEPVGATMR